MDEHTIISKLNSINWNFDFDIKYDESEVSPFNCRKYHSYPATFTPEIPYTLIEILSKKGDVVLDPFGGIGTTFFQAIILERLAYTFDVNIVADMVCNSLFCLLNPKNNLKKLQSSLQLLMQGYDEQKDYTCNNMTLRQELRDWFGENTFQKLSFLFVKYDKIKDPLLKTTCELILSSLLTTLSSQNKGWAYIADNVKPKPSEIKEKDVFARFRILSTMIIKDMERYLHLLPVSFNKHYEELLKEKRIYNSSITAPNLLGDNTVDLVVTSPPYPSMIDYIKSQRLSLYFEERDYKDYVTSEIGARYRRSSKFTLDQYLQNMNECNLATISKLKQGGYFCCVLPEFSSSEDPRYEIVQKVIGECASQGLTKIYEIGRYIPSSKRSTNIQWASLINERIYVFMKG